MSTSRSVARRALAQAVDAAVEATVVPSFSRLGIALRRRLEAWDEPPTMRGSVVVVTGGTSGIGLAAATAQHALELEVEQRNEALGATLQMEIQLYKAGAPMRDATR